MKQLALTTMAIGLLVSLNGMALPLSFLDTLEMTPSVDTTSTAPVQGCADFSGTWKGNCKVGEATKEESFEIAQKSCDALEIKGGHGKFFLPVGGVLGLGGSMPGTPAKAFGGNIDSHWNKEHSVLTLNIVGGGKKLVAEEAGRGLMLKENVQVENGKLVATFEGYCSEKGKFAGKCEFTKQ